MTDYEQLNTDLAQGWNTWNTYSVLSHVLLPEGFALNLGIKEYTRRRYLRQAFVGRQDQREERIHPGPHAYNGSYTELDLEWRGIHVTVQSATEDGDLVIHSARVIPGNEKSFSRMIIHLLRLGSQLITSASAPENLSGHPSQDELRQPLQLVRPRHLIPIPWNPLLQ